MRIVLCCCWESPYVVDDCLTIRTLSIAVIDYCCSVITARTCYVIRYSDPISVERLLGNSCIILLWFCRVMLSMFGDWLLYYLHTLYLRLVLFVINCNWRLAAVLSTLHCIWALHVYGWQWHTVYHHSLVRRCFMTYYWLAVYTRICMRVKLVWRNCWQGWCSSMQQ